MQTPSVNHLIRNDIDKFWRDKISLVIDTSDIRSFVREYLPLLGVDYDISIVAAILHIQQVKAAKVQSLISEIITLADSLRAESDTSVRIKLWRQLAKFVDYREEINSIIVDLTTRPNVVKYVKVMLSDDCAKLFPTHEIAYKIVNLMAHYEIRESDQPLYKIWDLATEIETMSLAEIEESGKWNEMVGVAQILR